MLHAALAARRSLSPTRPTARPHIWIEQRQAHAAIARIVLPPLPSRRSCRLCHGGVAAPGRGLKALRAARPLAREPYATRLWQVRPTRRDWVSNLRGCPGLEGERVSRGKTCGRAWPKRERKGWGRGPGDGDVGRHRAEVHHYKIRRHLQNAAGNVGIWETVAPHVRTRHKVGSGCTSADETACPILSCAPSSRRRFSSVSLPCLFPLLNIDSTLSRADCVLTPRLKGSMREWVHTNKKSDVRGWISGGWPDADQSVVMMDKVCSVSRAYRCVTRVTTEYNQRHTHF